MSKIKYGPLVMLHTKYQGSIPSGFRQEDFLYVFIMLVNVNSDLQDEVTLATEPKFDKYGSVPLGDATNQISKP